MTAIFCNERAECAKHAGQWSDNCSYCWRDKPNTVCGHEREALIWALLEHERRDETGRATLRLMATFTPLLLDMPEARSCIVAIVDPAKLAELLAEALPANGVRVAGLHVSNGLIGIAVMIIRSDNDPRSDVSDVYQLDATQARAALLRILALPAGATADDAMKALSQ